MKFDWLLGKKKFNGKTSEEWHDDGDAFLRVSKYEAAVKCYNMTLEIDPKDEAALKKKETAMREFKLRKEKQNATIQIAIKNAEAMLEDAKRLGLSEEMLKSAKLYFMSKSYEKALNDANDFIRYVRNAIDDEKRITTAQEAIKDAEVLLEDAKRLGLSENKLRNAKSHFQSKSYENSLNDANDFKREVKYAVDIEKQRVAAHKAIKNAEALLEEAKRLKLSLKENKLIIAKSHFQCKIYSNALKAANDFEIDVKNAIAVEKQRVTAQKAIKDAEAMLEDAKRLGVSDDKLRNAKSHFQSKSYENALNGADDFMRYVKNAVENEKLSTIAQEAIKNSVKNEKQHAAAQNAIEKSEALLEDTKRLGLNDDKLRNAKSHFDSKSYEKALNDANDFKKDVKNAIEDEKWSVSAAEAIKNAEALLEDAKRLGLSENKLKNAKSHFQRKSYKNALNDANGFTRHIKNALENEKWITSAEDTIKNAEALLEDAKRLGLSENKLKNAKSYFQNKYYKNALKYASHFERDVKNAIEDEKHDALAAHEAIQNAEALLEDAKRLGLSENKLNSAKLHFHRKYYTNALNDANGFIKPVKNAIKDEKRNVFAQEAIQNAEKLLEDAKRLGLSENKLNSAKSHFQNKSYENAMKDINDFERDVVSAIEDEKRSASAKEIIINAEKLLEDAKRLGLSEIKLKSAKSHFQSKSYENALNDANDFEREVKDAIEDEKRISSAKAFIINAEKLLGDAKRLGLSEIKLNSAKSHFQNKSYENAMKDVNDFERDIENALEYEKQHSAAAHEAIKNAEALLDDAKRLGLSENKLNSAKSHFQSKSYESAIKDVNDFEREIKDAINFQEATKNALKDKNQRAAAYKCIKNAEKLLEYAKRLGLSEEMLKSSKSHFQSKSYENALNDANVFTRDVKNAIQDEKKSIALQEAIQNAEKLLKEANAMGLSLSNNKLKDSKSLFQGKSYENALKDVNDYTRYVKNAIEDERHRIAAQQAINSAKELEKIFDELGLSFEDFESIIKDAESDYDYRNYADSQKKSNECIIQAEKLINVKKPVIEKLKKNASIAIRNAEKVIEEAKAMGLSLSDNKLRDSKSLFQSKSYEKALNSANDCTKDAKNAIEDENQRLLAQQSMNSAKELAKIFDELGLSFEDFESIIKDAKSDYEHRRYVDSQKKSNECIIQAEKFINVKKPIIEKLKKDGSIAIIISEKLFEEAKAMGLSLSDNKLRDSKSLFQSKSYEKALNSANDCTKYAKNAIEEEKNRQNAQTSINSLNTLLDKLKKLSLDIPDTGEINVDFESKNYLNVSEKACKLREEIESRITSSKPALFPKLHITDFKLGAGKKMQIFLRNDGNTPARKIIPNLAAEDITIRILTELEVLNPGESKPVDVWIKPAVEGDLPVEISIKYSDGLERSYETKEEFWINVSDKVSERVLSTEIENIVQTPADFTPRPSHTTSFPPELSKYYTEPELIGKGGFARVFRAKKKSDGRIVALKIPISLDEATGRSFVREINAWNNLKHVNIVELYDLNVLPIPYLELEYVEKNLEELKKPVEIETAARIIYEIAEGMGYAHSKGLIHRDLKPHNILLAGDQVPKITDWGLSKIMAESKSSSQYGFSPVYAAPEQISPKKFGAPDKRTDIYQLGVVFYELVCGRLPFGGEDFAGISSAIIFEEPEAPSSVIAVAKVVEQIILTSLAKKKEERYQSMDELQRDLGKYLQVEYKKSLKESQSKHNMKRSSHYCCELFLLNLKLQEVSDALKYCLDMQNYAKGEIKDEVAKLSEALKFKVKGGNKIGDEFMEAAKVVAHQVRMGWK